jgi:DNA polymerase-3 subunit gamma/tau
VAIAEGRHIDVIEMDAASHTGVDDVREIIEAVRYSAVSARFKIYIIDEVHMLSRNAFNALLKTLEEPPPHVKFLFATTEVDKLPVTVLSRCQRFDLRRIPAGLLAEHFAGICRAEQVDAELEALAMIAEAAEGSVRDGLSILDQAIAHADLAGSEDMGADGTMVSASQVRDMLGLADKTMQRRLFAALLEADAPGLLDLVAQQYALGVEPLAMIRAVMDITHRVTLAQVGKSGAQAISADERTAIDDWAARLGAGQLHRLWQLLVKGHDEVRAAPEPLAGAQMALLRCLHAIDLPDPGQLVARLEELATRSPSAAFAAQPSPAAESAAVAETVNPAQAWAALADRVEAFGEMRVAQIMRDWVRVVDLGTNELRYAMARGFAGDPAGDLRAGLLRATGEVWRLERLAEGGEPTLRERDEMARAEADVALRRSPMVEAAFAAFPQAQFLNDGDPARPQSDRNSDRNRSQHA